MIGEGATGTKFRRNTEDPFQPLLFCDSVNSPCYRRAPATPDCEVWGPQHGPASVHSDSHWYGHYSLKARAWIMQVVKIKCLPQQSDIKVIMRKASNETVSVLFLMCHLGGEGPHFEYE